MIKTIKEEMKSDILIKTSEESLKKKEKEKEEEFFVITTKEDLDFRRDKADSPW